MPTSQELINQQFAEAGKGLLQKRKQAEDQLGQAVARRQAMGGLTGGAALKAQSKGAQQLEEAFGAQEAALQSEKARTSLAAQEAETQRQFGAAEAEKGRTFQATQAEKDRAQQKDQFEKTFGLQQQQFAETARQFNEGMRFQWAELDENQVSNFINALTALRNVDVTSWQGIEPTADAVTRLRNTARNYRMLF